MKKLVSFIITFIMCFVSPLSIANAQEQPNNQNLISIENISNTSKYYGQKIKFITSDEFNLDDLQSYDVILQYEKLKDGSENYYFMDKSASNIITIKSNNDVYVLPWILSRMLIGKFSMSVWIAAILPNTLSVGVILIKV